MLDNSANLHIVDAANGEHLAEVNIGRVGKASPVVADGKVYVTEVNGRMVIVDVSGETPEILHTAKIRTGRRWAETYGSVAISHGRIFFTNEASLFAIGVPNDDPVETPTFTLEPGNAEGDRVGLLVREPRGSVGVDRGRHLPARRIARLPDGQGLGRPRARERSRPSARRA